MKRNERGIALMTALFALLLLTGIGFGLLYMTDAETMINSNYRSSQQAYFAAMAGLQNVRERLTVADVAPHKLTQAPVPAPGNPATPGSAGSILYVINPGATPTTLGSADYDTQLQAEYTSLALGWPPAGNTYIAPFAPDDVGLQPGVNAAIYNLNPIPYRWVRVEQKLNGSNAPYYSTPIGTNGANAQTPICWNGANELPLTLIGDPDCAHGLGSDPPSHTPVYLLTAYASVPTNPPTTRVLQMEVAQDPPLSTHGAVDSQDHVNLNGQLTVNGYDYCSCTCTTTGSGNNQTTTCTNRVTGAIAPTCDATHYSIYSASTVQNPNSSETLIAGTNPPVVQNQPWTWDVQELVQRFSTTPGAVNVTNAPYNWNCSGGACGTQSNVTLGVPPTFPPSPANNPIGPANMQSQITIVPGNLQLTSNSSVGNGVLVVNGNLDIHGGLQFYGVIIVTGVISFTGGGSSGTNIYGAVIAGQQSYVDTTLGGSANINFDYCALPNGSTTQPPRSLALRDINF
jgi:hypothetical protein